MGAQLVGSSGLRIENNQAVLVRRKQSVKMRHGGLSVCAAGRPVSTNSRRIARNRQIDRSALGELRRGDRKVAFERRTAAKLIGEGSGSLAGFTEHQHP